MSTIIRPAFAIEENDTILLAQGKIALFGGILRYTEGPNKGAIYKHLKPVSLPEESNGQTLRQTMQANYSQAQQQSFFAQHKKGIIVTGAVTFIIITGIGIYMRTRSKKQKQFHQAFTTYCNALRTGTITTDIIQNLENHLDGVKEVKLSPSEFSLLVSEIKKYTIMLAEANNIDVSTMPTTGDNIINMQTYLKQQKAILRSA